MKKRIFLQNKLTTERAEIDSIIAEKFGMEFLESHLSVPLSVLNKLSLQNKQKAPRVEYEILNRLRQRGYNVQHQQPVLYRYIPDMVHFFFKDNVIIEIDGPSHEGRRFQDRERSMLLESFKFEVMRFETPKDVRILEKIVAQIERRLKPYRLNKPLMSENRPTRLYPDGVKHPLFQAQIEFAKARKKNG